MALDDFDHVINLANGYTPQSQLSHMSRDPKFVGFAIGVTGSGGLTTWGLIRLVKDRKKNAAAAPPPPPPPTMTQKVGNTMKENLVATACLLGGAALVTAVAVNKSKNKRRCFKSKY